MIDLGPRCLFCKHFIKDAPLACRAFPNLIPVEIFSGKKEHLSPRKDDNGFQFELNPDLPPEIRSMYIDRFETKDH